MKTMKGYFAVVLLLVILSLSLLSAAAQDVTALPDRGWLRGGLAWSPDSTMLAVSSSLGVWIYAVDTWEDVLFRGDQHYITSLAWSPDGREIASTDGIAIDIWDAATGETRLTLKGPDTIYVVSWSPDGRLLASGSWDFNVRLWDTVSGDTRHSIDIPQREDISIFPSSIGWSPNGDRIVVNGITIWDVATGSMLQEWTDVDPTEIARWQPGGERIASSTFDGHIEIRDATNGDLLTRLAGHPKFVSTLAWSPNGQYLVSTGGFDREDSRQVKVWDATTGKMVVELEKGITTGDATFYEYALAWSPDGRWLASTSDDGTVHLWDTATWQLVRVDDRYYSLIITDDFILPTIIPTTTPNSE